VEAAPHIEIDYAVIKHGLEPVAPIQRMAGWAA
jgi:hypothetical protein